MRILIIAILPLALACGEMKEIIHFQDCSALYKENVELKKELEEAQKLAKSEKYWRDSYNVFWVDQLAKHDEHCDFNWGFPKRKK